jgi:hypothetical protein
MKTLALNPDKNYQENMEDIIEYFCTHAHGERELTGLFAFEDRSPYMLHFPRWNSKPILPDKLANAIIRWCEKGKGWGIIHSRSYPHGCKPRSERMPLKLSDEKYFYHIGGYGSTYLWNEVTRARRVRRPTNVAVYERWIEAQTSEDFIDTWGRHHLLTDEGNERTRSFSSFIWNDGMIEKFNMYEDDYEDNSPSRYKVFDIEGHAKDNTLTYRHAFTMQPQWDGVN